MFLTNPVKAKPVRPVLGVGPETDALHPAKDSYAEAVSRQISRKKFESYQKKSVTIQLV